MRMDIFSMGCIGVLSLFFVGCVKTDDFELPDLSNVPVEINGHLTSIEAVKGVYTFDTEEIHTFLGTDTWITGYVISDDSGGNFYKELIIQDKASDPEAGIQILLDQNSIFETFNFGRKVFVKLDGLSLGYKNGVHLLGYQNRGDVVAIPYSMIDEHLVRSNEISEIVPKKIEIAEVSPQLKNLYVRFDGLQFDRNLVRENLRYSFASHPSDRYDGIRQLESCETGETLHLSTSTFSNFKSLLLPSGSGSLEGILTRDFYDEQYVIMVNSPHKLSMGGVRCDPVFLDCAENTEPGPQIIFEENFEGVTSNTTLNSRGWSNLNLSGGETKFKPTLASGNRVLRISAYNTNESPLEAWLVSPPVDLSGQSNEVLSFDILSSYDRGLLMEVYVTKQFNGDPRHSEWIELDANIPMGPSNSSSTSFKKSRIDISCLDGKVWFAFRYLGAAPDKTTTYDMDNLRVTGN